MKVYSEGGSMPEGGVAGAVPQGGSNEPTIDELD